MDLSHRSGVPVNIVFQKNLDHFNSASPVSPTACYKSVDICSYSVYHWVTRGILWCPLARQTLGPCPCCTRWTTATQRACTSTYPTSLFQSECLPFYVDYMDTHTHTHTHAHTHVPFCFFACSSFKGDNAVLQVMYNTNNPNAPATFYQCADIYVG